MKFSELPTHLFFINKVNITQFGPQFTVGAGSSINNQAVNRLLALTAICNPNKKQIDKDFLERLSEKFKDIEYPEIDFKEEPKAEFIEKFVNIENRLRFTFTGYAHNAKTTSKRLFINFPELTLYYHHLYNEWVSPEALERAFHNRGKGTDDLMAIAVKCSLSPNAQAKKENGINCSPDCFSKEIKIVKSNLVPDAEIINWRN